MVMAERPVRKDTFVLARGAYDKPGEKVEPACRCPASSPGARITGLDCKGWSIRVIRCSRV
jgi:hypothetical protein